MKIVASGAGKPQPELEVAAGVWTPAGRYRTRCDSIGSVGSVRAGIGATSSVRLPVVSRRLYRGVSGPGLGGSSRRNSMNMARTTPKRTPSAMKSDWWPRK